MNDIPSTSVIRHWIAWDNDEHDFERVQLFEAWFARELEQERARIIDLLEGLKGDCPLACGDCEEHAASVWTAIRLIRGGAE
jgi:hypothetical protein